MRRRLLLGVALGVVALLAPVLWRKFGSHRPRFTYDVGTLSPADYQALASKPQWSAVSLETAPGVALSALVRRPQAATAPWIAFFSGNDHHPLATGQKFVERVRDGRDWGVFLFSYRGYDSCPGVPSPSALTNDALVAFRHVLDAEHVDPSRVHLVAFSLGGYLAATVAGEAARTHRKAATLSLLASVQDIEMVRSPLLARFVEGDVYEIEPLLPAVPAPVLVVQGGADEALGAVQGQRIAAALGDRARYLELPGVGHNILLETDAAIVAVREMIEAHSR